MFGRLSLLSSILIVVALIACLFVLKGCLQRLDTFGIVGKPAINFDNQCMIALVAENNATTYSENGGYRKTDYHTVYWLKQYDLQTGKLKNKTRLGSTDNFYDKSVENFGIAGNQLWIYFNGFKVYDARSLEKRADEQSIINANNGNDVFPVERRLVRPNLKKGVIDFISYNGESYRLQMADLHISKKPFANDDNDAKAIRMFEDDRIGARCDTMNGKFYMFAKDIQSTEGLHPEHSDISEKAYRCKFFSSGYTAYKLGNHTSYNKISVSQIGERDYLNPLLLVDGNSNEAIKLKNPESYLVIHQDVLGKDAKAVASMLHTNGSVAWEKKMPFSTRISNCILAGNLVVLTSNKDYMYTPFIGNDELCSIHLQTGHIQRFSLNE